MRVEAFQYDRERAQEVVREERERLMLRKLRGEVPASSAELNEWWDGVIRGCVRVGYAAKG